MAFTIPYLRGVASKVADAFGLSVADASRVVGYYSLQGDGVGVQGCENLDITIIKAAADSVGVVLPGSDADGSKADFVKNKEKDHGGGADAETVKHTEKTHKKAENRTKSEKPTNTTNTEKKARPGAKTEKKVKDFAVGAADVLQNIKENENLIYNTDARGTGAGMPGGGLISIEIIESIFAGFCDRYHIESPEKMTGLQFRAACMLVGQYIKDNKIIDDIEKQRRQGGRVLDAEKVSYLIDVFAFVASACKKVALISDFAAFAGVSLSWIYDCNGACSLTSASGNILKKLQDLQGAGVASGIVNDQTNPVGKMFFSKVFLGWSENGKSDTVDIKNGISPDALPIFSRPD